MRFTYAKSWLDTPGARPISLSLPLSAKPLSGDIVYNFFDNLLPDNPDIRLRIQRRFSCSTSHPFDLLRAIGSDCVGALQFGESAEMPNVKTVHSTPVSDTEISEILRDYIDAPLGMSRSNDEFRISLAGAQEKTSFLHHKNKWHIPLGPTPASHIIKLPIGMLQHFKIDMSHSCENEWLCMKIAKAYSLPVADVALKKFGSIQTLIVDRFDRRWASDGTWLMRIPQEDVCQALGVSGGLKYESDGGPGIIAIMDLLSQSNHAERDRGLFLKAQMLFWMLGAIDGHAKNFSIRLLPDGRFELTPLYDILSAAPFFSKHKLPVQKAKMAMAVFGTKKKYYGINRIRKRHWISTAQKAEYSTESAHKIADELFERLDEVKRHVSDMIPANFPDYIADGIFRWMQKVRDG